MNDPVPMTPRPSLVTMTLHHAEFSLAGASLSGGAAGSLRRSLSVSVRYARPMGSNITRQTRRAKFLRLPLSDLTAWHLIVTCAGCPGPPRYLPISVLAGRYGMQRQLGSIVPRLRCQFRTCGQYPSSVKLCSSLDLRDAKLVLVVLAGPGAF